MYTLLVVAQSRYWTEQYSTLNDLIENLPSVEDRYEAFVYGPNGLVDFNEFLMTAEQEADALVNA